MFTEDTNFLKLDFIIWNSNFGVRDFVTIDQDKIDLKSKKAWLDEPYEMVGPFCLDELYISGEIRFDACIVMTQQQWSNQQNTLQKESQKKFYDEINNFNKRKQQTHIDQNNNNQKEHRELLHLPSTGILKISQIKLAYRKIVKKVHPDVGGSHEMFIQTTKARDSLLQNCKL